MSGLSLQEIADYNHKSAFTRVRNQSARTAATFMGSISQSNSNAVRTKNLSESYSLIKGLNDRYQMVRENLSTMLGYVEMGASARTEKGRDEAIGYLRSLSGGIDDIVDQTKWQGMNTMDGRRLDISLNNNGAGASKRLQLNSLYSSDEMGLNLTKQPATGTANIRYDFYSQIRNQESGVVGLNISDAYGSDTDSTHNELETGSYRLEISYAGPDSSITIKNLEGIVLNTVNDVDLSGEGEELVDLGVGASLSISKDQYLDSIDKYDYENLGPAKLYAVMDYERVYRHELSNEDFSHFTEQDITVNYQNKVTNSSGGTMRFDSINMSGISPDETGFETGAYSLRVNYNGENSSVVIMDNQGRMKYLDYKVDLSGDEDIKIDTGKGVNFTISKSNFTEDSGQLLALFDYQASDNNNENFDFNAYHHKIENAIHKLDKDWEVLLETESEILKANQYQNNSAYYANASTTSGGMIASLLGSSMSSTASSIFGVNQANGSLAQASNTIFSNTISAMSVQAKVRAVKYVG